jgi:hypothetical protein
LDENGDSTMAVNSERDTLHKAMGVFYAVGEELQSTRATVFKHGSARLLSCVRASMMLRNRIQLLSILHRTIHVVFGDSALRGISADIEAQLKVPSNSTVSRAQVQMDGALLLLEREMFSEEPAASWILADSSPQLRFDFLISLFVSIKECNLRRCFEA